MVDVLGGYTKLMLLIENGDVEGVEDLLTKGVDVNAQNKGGQTALVIAARNGATQIVAKLLEHGADISIANRVGQTALFTACSQNFENIVKLMINYGADINIKDSRGWTPLMLACYHDHINIVKILLQGGADIIAEDSFGKTALNRTRSPEIFQELAIYAQKELENCMQAEANNERELELSRENLKPPIFKVNQRNLRGGFELDALRSPNGCHSTKSKLLEKERTPIGTRVSKKINKLLEFDPKRGDISSHPATMLLRKKKQDQIKQKPEKVQGGELSKPTQESTHLKSQKGSPFQKTEENETKKVLRIATCGFEEELASKTEAQLKSTRKYLSNVRSPSQEYSKKLKNPRHSYNNPNASRGPRKSINPNARQTTHQYIPTRMSTKENIPHELNNYGQSPTATQECSSLKDTRNEENQSENIKGLLKIYVEDYSKLIQNYLHQKVSNSLEIQGRRNLAAARQELASGILQSVLIFHKDLIESLRKVATSLDTDHINYNLISLNEKMTNVIEEFENKMLYNTEDQDALDILYERSQELDSLHEIEKKYFQYEEGVRDESERGIIAFLKQETSNQASGVYLMLNEIFQNECNNSEPLYKGLVQENVKELIGKFSACLKESFDHFILPETSNKGKQLAEDSDEPEKIRNQYTNETDHEGQELPLQSVDTNVSYLKDSDKEISGDISRISHGNISSNGNLAIAKNYNENYSLNHYSLQRPNNPILIMSLSHSSCQQPQTTPRLHESSPRIERGVPNENIDYKGDLVLENMEQISRTVDHAISRKNSSSNKKASLLRKKSHYFQNLHLFEDQGFDNQKSTLRNIERRAMVDVCEARNSIKDFECEQPKQEEFAPVEQEAEVREYLQGENPLNPPDEEDNGVVRDLTQHFQSFEMSKPEYEESCELTATDGTGNESRDGQPKCPNELESEILNQENDQEVEEKNPSEKEEVPEQLIVREEEQRDYDKFAYLIEKVVTEENKSLDTAKELSSYRMATSSPIKLEIVNAIPELPKEIHFSTQEKVAQRKMELIDKPFKTLESRNPLQTPDLPRPTASSQVKKKTIKSVHPSTVSLAVDDELQSFENKLLENKGFENSPGLSRSIVIESTNSLRNFGRSTPRSNKKSEPFHNCDPSATALSIQDNPKRNALTQSLVVECRNLSLDVSRAIANSNKMHLDYMLNKEKFLRKPMAESKLCVSNSNVK